MTKQFLNWLIGLIKSNNIHPFYISTEWLKVRADALRLDKNECQICKDKGRYNKARIVHHINHLKKAPQLALSIWYEDASGEKKRNLISVCKDCHETICHPNRMGKRENINKFKTIERWD